MNRRRKKAELNTRMEKFLYYSKFVTLIIVAVLFIIAYSFTYRDFPVSTAYHQFADHSDDIQPSEVTYPKINVLIVMDYQSSYKNGVYENFSLIKPLADNIYNIDFDLVLLDNTKNSSVLSNTGSGLIMRIYQNKDYDYIVALGENSSDSAKEIHRLFFPKSKLVLYGMSGAKISAVLSSSYSVSKNIISALSVSEQLNPKAKTMLFLCDDNNYSRVITSIANNYINQYENLSSVIIYSNEKNVNEVSSYIDENSDDLSVFYVSFLGENENKLHSEIINSIQNSTEKIIYDLSAPENDKAILSSLRFWEEGTSESAAGYLAIPPESTSDTNFEFIDFIAANMPSSDYISPNGEYHDSASFIGWCLNNIGIADFPQALPEQFSYCTDNLLLISKDKLQPGDLIFISSDSGVLPENIEEIAVYINEDTVLTAGENGTLCFTKMLPDKYQAAYVHPFSVLGN